MALYTPYGTLLPPGAIPPAPRMPVPTPPAGAAPVTPAPAVPGASPPPSSGGAPGAPGGGNPLFSAFNRAYQNPLFHIGAGLLSQGPSLTPINPWAGLAGGLASFGQARALQAEQERQQAELKLRREEMDWKREQAEAKAKAATAQDEAAVRALVSGGMDVMRARDIVAAGQAGAFLEPEKPAGAPTLKQVIDPATGRRVWMPAEQAVGMAAPEPAVPTTNVYPAPRIVSTPGGGRVMARFDANGNPILTEIVPPDPGAARRGTLAEDTADAMRSGEALIQDYVTKAEAYQNSGLSAMAGIDIANLKEEAEKARKNLATWWATNILGKPGTEPSPRLYEQADEAIGDFAGMFDNPRFPSMIAGLRSSMRAKLAGGETVEAEEETTTVPPGVDGVYNPATQQVER